jgi:hypothetical protein
MFRYHTGSNDIERTVIKWMEILLCMTSGTACMMLILQKRRS